MRLLALSFAVLLLAPEGSAECAPPVNLKARQFISHSTDLARATGVSAYEVRITTVLLGQHAKVGDVIVIPSRECRPGPVPGSDYYLRRFCFSASDCQWLPLEVERANGFEDYVRQRHYVARPQVIEQLQAWQHEKLATDKFQQWLATADADDDDVEGPSLTLEVVELTEDLLGFVQAASSCRPADAARFRKYGSSILLTRFRALPREEKLSKYQAWLDAHQESADQWDPEALRKDVESRLEQDSSWRRAEDCVQQSREKQRSTLHE